MPCGSCLGWGLEGRRFSRVMQLRSDGCQLDRSAANAATGSTMVVPTHTGTKRSFDYHLW